MARIVPPHVLDNWQKINGILSAGKNAEYETLAHLRDALPDQLTVFFNLHWNVRDEAALHAREVDFIVVDPEGNCLLVEQKLGDLIERPEGLFKAYGHANVKDVTQQIHDSRDGLRDQFSRQHGGKPLKIDYILYCPHHMIQDISASGLDEKNILDSRDKGALANVIAKRLTSRRERPTEFGKAVLDFFYQTLKIVPDVSSLRADQSQRFLQLVETPIELLESIEMHPFRLHVRGCAGCGKSQIALRFLERAINNGERTLFVCYNHPLKERIAGLVGDGADVTTLHGMIHRFCLREDVPIAYEPGQKTPQEWQELVEAIVVCVGDNEAVYDSLIVDEGQDLTADEYEFIRLFLKPDASILWLADTDQEVGQARGRPFKGSDFVRVTLRRNYRSPASIARFVTRVFPDRFQPSNDIEGLSVGRHGYTKPSEQEALVARIVDKWLKRGFRLSDMAVVSLRGVQSTAFRDVEVISSYPVKRFTGRYVDDQQEYTNGDLLFETVRRFKGQQAPLVILVDVDPDPAKSWDLNAVYIGMTRATIRLEIVGKCKNDFNREKLGVPS